MKNIQASKPLSCKALRRCRVVASVYWILHLSLRNGQYKESLESVKQDSSELIIYSKCYGVHLRVILNQNTPSELSVLCWLHMRSCKNPELLLRRIFYTFGTRLEFGHVHIYKISKFRFLPSGFWNILVASAPPAMTGAGAMTRGTPWYNMPASWWVMSMSTWSEVGPYDHTGSTPEHSKSTDLSHARKEERKSTKS